MNDLGLSVVVLAGDRGEDDALRAHTGLPCKALVRLHGRPLLERVTTALDTFAPASERILVGPAAALEVAEPDLCRKLEHNGWRMVAPQPSPAASAVAGIEVCRDDHGVLLTTIDHALLNTDILAEFIDGARAQAADIVVGFARFDDVMSAYPESVRTGWKLKDGRFCGCNLFYLANPSAVSLVRFWRQVEQHRKKPWRIVQAIGKTTLLRYLLGALTLEDGLKALGQRAGLRLAPFVLSAPRAAIDVDSPADLELAERIIASAS